MPTIKDYLTGCGFFSELTASELNQLGEKLSLVEFKTGAVIFNEGDPGDKMFVIVKGEVAILKTTEFDQRKMRTIGCGESLGELGLFAETRTAGAIAESDVLCLEMNNDDFLTLARECPVLYQRINQIIISRIRYSEDSAGRQLVKAYETLVFTLSDLAECRDPETGGHLSRVSHYCKRLAELLQQTAPYKNVISDAFIRYVFVGSPLHDIGKVGIPDNVLLKPGRLTPEEFAVMKTHATIGAQTLKKVTEKCDIQVFRVAYNIVHYHHERYDGKGYPTGLAGENIPLEARIMAIADVFDALMSKRVYKPKFSEAQTMEIIRDGMGSQFDAFIAQLLLEHFNEFSEIHDRYHD